MHPPLERFYLDHTFYGRTAGGVRGTLLVNSLYLLTLTRKQFSHYDIKAEKKKAEHKGLFMTTMQRRERPMMKALLPRHTLHYYRYPQVPHEAQWKNGRTFHPTSGSTSGPASGSTSGGSWLAEREPAAGRQYSDGKSQSYGTSWSNHYQSPTKGSSYDSRYDAPEKGDSNRYVRCNTTDRSLC